MTFGLSEYIFGTGGMDELCGTKSVIDNVMGVDESYERFLICSHSSSNSL